MDDDPAGVSARAGVDDAEIFSDAAQSKILPGSRLALEHKPSELLERCFSLKGFKGSLECFQSVLKYIIFIHRYWIQPATLLANICLSEFDDIIKGDGEIYFRYMDDVLNDVF